MGMGMITYKTKTTYKKLERRDEKVIITTGRGWKLKYKDYTFYADQNTLAITEEITGQKLPAQNATIEDAGNYIIQNYETIDTHVKERIKEGLTIKQVEEQNGES